MKRYLYIAFLILVLIALILIPNKTKAEAPAPVIPPKPTDVKGLIVYWADEYNVSAENMAKVIKCESNFNPNAINSTSREYSVGIAQINLKAHTHITKEQAHDPDFAAEFMAKEFARGNARIWTCSKITGILYSYPHSQVDIGII